MKKALSLSDALRSGRMSEFIAQEEASGIGPVSEADFDALAAQADYDARIRAALEE